MEEQRREAFLEYLKNRKRDGQKFSKESEVDVALKNEKLHEKIESMTVDQLGKLLGKLDGILDYISQKYSPNPNDHMAKKSKYLKRCLDKIEEMLRKKNKEQKIDIQAEIKERVLDGRLGAMDAPQLIDLKKKLSTLYTKGVLGEDAGAYIFECIKEINELLKE